LESLSFYSWESAYPVVSPEDWPPKIRMFKYDMVCFSTLFHKPDFLKAHSWIGFQISHSY
jgi:hypothetical protein